jgi:two-component system, chemotaxis family, protein-glutamate methylesterase/glutaminase
VNSIKDVHNLKGTSVEPKKVKLLIVDDSVLFRSQIQLALKDVPEIEIVGTASNGRIAIEKMQELQVDVVTMDIEMPVLDGIGALAEMMALGIQAKVIMFSSLSVAGAQKTLEAMKMGAVDFVPKPQPDQTNISPAAKIRSALLPKIFSLFGLNQTKSVVSSGGKRDFLKFTWEHFHPEVLVIASSTGGPNALIEFFSALKDPLPFPVLLTQHMPALFTASLAERIGAHSGKVSKEAIHGEGLRPNQIYVAPGNYHMSLSGDRRKPTICLDQEAPRNFVRPCADFLFESAARIYGRNTLGIVLTGMGRDGGDGAKAIKDHKGAVLIQNEESCVVFGMPGSVFDEGHFDFEGTPQELAQKILILIRSRRAGNVA